MSEYGRGLCYNLGLFLAHAEREFGFNDSDERKMFNTHLWFSSASEHLYNIDLENAPDVVKIRLKKFVNKCLNWGHGADSFAGTYPKNKFWAIQEAKELLRLIDKANGIKTEKAEHD